MCDVDGDAGGLRVGGRTGVVAGVGRASVGNAESRADPRLSLNRDANAASFPVVVDHALVVVPKDVLRRRATLERKIQVNFYSTEKNQRF